MQSWLIMEFLGARIKLNPRPARQTIAALEVAMLGHCPGRARIGRLLALPDALEEMRLSGFGTRVDALSSGADTDLYHLPVPFRSSAEFEDIFPDTFSTSTQYASKIAGEQAWLPLAVEDFFANGGEKLWVVRVPEEEGDRGFLPVFDAPLYDTESLRGLAAVLVLNNVGLVALPDLERIQIPAFLPDIPSMHLVDAEPQFLTCNIKADEGASGQGSSHHIAEQATPLPLLLVLRKILSLINRHRPDIQCLYSLPLGYSEVLASPAIDETAIAGLEVARSQNGAHLLRQVQLLFPYLRSDHYQLQSAVGVIAGLIAGSARRRGIWRSVAGTPILTGGRPYPPTCLAQTIALRESPGVGVIVQRSGKVALDDERLTVPALHRNDYESSQYSESLHGMRSAEVVRFIGFLKRQLKSLGERLVFNVGYDDPRPRLILEKFFLGLYSQGALRGDLPEKAFTIRQASDREAVIAFDIEITPAHPIDKIVLTFINRQGEWLSEVQDV